MAFNKENHFSISKEFQQRNEKKALDYAENIFSYYNIALTVMNEEFEDSALCLFPISNNNNVIQILENILPLLCAFPHSFIRAIELKNLTICEDYVLYNDKHTNLLNKKFLNGLFCFNSLDNPEKIRDHLIKVLSFALQRKVEYMAKLSKDGRSKFSKNNMNFTQMIQSFKAMLLIRDGQDLIPNPTLLAGIGILESEMREIDPIGINDAWLSGVNVENQKKSFDDGHNPLSAYF